MADTWPKVGRKNSDMMVNNSWPTVGGLLANSWPTVGRQSTNSFFGELFFTFSETSVLFIDEISLIFLQGRMQSPNKL